MLWRAIWYDVNMVLEECSVAAAIRYKKWAQIFVSSVNKNRIRYTIRDATKNYTV